MVKAIRSGSTRPRISWAYRERIQKQLPCPGKAKALRPRGKQDCSSSLRVGKELQEKEMNKLHQERNEWRHSDRPWAISPPCSKRSSEKLQTTDLMIPVKSNLVFSLSPNQESATEPGVTNMPICLVFSKEHALVYFFPIGSVLSLK